MSCRASAIRTEEEIRMMREDALFRAKVTFPFYSETSTLVDAPGVQDDVPEPSIPKAKSIGGPNQDEWEMLNASEMPKLVPTSDVSSSKDFKRAVLQATEATKLEMNPKAVEAPGNTRLSSNVPAAPIGDRVHHSSPEPSEPGAPHSSGTETLEGEADAGDRSSQDAPRIPIWFGDLSRSGFDASYLSLRDQLSDAAYWGAFDRMFSVLAEAERTYRESWANAPRLSKSSFTTTESAGTQDDGSSKSTFPFAPESTI